MNETRSQGDWLGRRPRVRRKRALWRLLIGLVLCVVFLLGIYFYYSLVAANELEAAMAAADQVDPGWRADELVAKRKPVAKKENGAVQVAISANLLPADWNTMMATDKVGELLELDPRVMLNDQQLAFLDVNLRKARPSLVEARKLKDFPTGRSEATSDLDLPAFSLPPHLEQVRMVCLLLVLDAMYQVQKGDYEGGWTSSHAALNAGRSIGDEPAMSAMLLRIGRCRTALESMERTLAQGEVAEKLLLQSQLLLQNESTKPLLLVGLRGYRANLHRFLEEVEAGKTSLWPTTNKDNKAKKLTFLIEAKELFLGHTLKYNHAWALRYMTEAVEICKRPKQQQEAFLDLEKSLESAPLVAKQFSDPAGTFRYYHLRCLALLRCAVAALGAERYRLKHGRWPRSLAQLVPGQLRTVPTDPYAKESLRLQRFQDGLVVYSVGPDGKDKNGTLNRKNFRAEGSDTSFRLWNVGNRRKVARGPGHEGPGDKGHPAKRHADPPLALADLP